MAILRRAHPRVDPRTGRTVQVRETTVAGGRLAGVVSAAQLDRLATAADSVDWDSADEAAATPAATRPVVRFTLTETAGLARQHLKTAFPGTRFSVTTERFAGGTALNVKWTDGPTVRQVDRATGGFASGGFDGSIDMGYPVESWYCGDHGPTVRSVDGTEGQRGSVQEVHNDECCEKAQPAKYGAKFVTVSRALSPGLRGALEEELRSVLSPPAGHGSDWLQGSVSRTGEIWRGSEPERTSTLVHQLSVFTSVGTNGEVIRQG